MVAVVVPSPASSPVLLATLFTSCAPVFSKRSSSSISLATVTPSLVIGGAPNFFSMITLRPLGPSVTLTALANWSTPCFSKSRASILNTISFAMIILLFIIYQLLRERHFDASLNTLYLHIQVLCLNIFHRELGLRLSESSVHL